MVIYADVVLFVNLIMNTMILFMTGWSAGLKRRWPRLIAAAILGGVYALGEADPALHYLYWPPLKVIISAIMVWISFGSFQLRRGLFLLGLFYLFSFLFGGAVLGWINLMQNGPDLLNMITVPQTIYWGSLAGGVCAAAVLVVLIAKRLMANAAQRPRVFTLTLGYRQKEVSFPAALDTGNHLFTLISRRPVIPVCVDVLAEVLSEEVRKFLEQTPSADWVENVYLCQDPEWMSRVEILPCRGVCGQSVMLGFRPDYVVIVDVENQISVRSERAVIGLYAGQISTAFPCAALVHPALIQEIYSS